MGVNNFMPEICWNRYFIAAQGYNVKDNCLHQGNKGFILMVNNGKASSSKRKKYINIRYLFITDRVNKGEVSVLWCPTGGIIRDYRTKLLQVAMFWKFR